MYEEKLNNTRTKLPNLNSSPLKKGENDGIKSRTQQNFNTFSGTHLIDPYP